MQIPTHLINSIQSGNVVLLLGSGALYGSSLPDNKKIPLGNDLRDLLSDQFLNAEFKDNSLAYVAELSISESSLFEVQDFIGNYFQDIAPASFHAKVADFKWRRIYTTNYDQLIETIYRNHPNPLQKILPILSDSEIRDSQKLRSDQLEYYKLHGCITRTRDSNLPLVLTIDDFNNTLEEQRKNMMNTLYEVAIECPIIFVGHSHQDPNIRNMMNKVRNENPQGQRHYLIKPNATDVESRNMETKKITILNMGFNDFLDQIDNKIPKNTRLLSTALKENEYPVQKLFTTNSKPSYGLQNLLDIHCQYIHQNIPTGTAEPLDFFKGKDIRWAGIQNKYPIERNLKKKIVQEIFESPESSRIQNFEFVVITGASGTGKTTFLRQLAWSVSQNENGIALWVNPNGEPEVDAVIELNEKSSERVYIFWDDLDTNKNYILKFIKLASKRNSKISVIGCERTNLWNTNCSELDEYSTDLFTLNRMSENEISKLMTSLDKFGILSNQLKSLSHKLRCEEISNHSDRHLLVALYEITTGKKFENIVIDEFEKIKPYEAQKIYQTICTLNRYKIPVRAGVVSRIHNISFDDFRDRLFKPLEDIIYAHINGDITYVARHPEIAYLVDRHALNTPEKRIDEYYEIIKSLNNSYTIDRNCLKQLLRSKNIKNVFNNVDDALKVYDFAISIHSDSSYLLHHKAKYMIDKRVERFEEIKNILNDAISITPNNAGIFHSFCQFYMWQVNLVESENKKEIYRREALGCIEEMERIEGRETTFSASARIDVKLQTLGYVLSNADNLTQSHLQEKVNDCREVIQSFKVKFPEDNYFNELDKRFKRLINDHKGYIEAAKKSYEEGHQTSERAMTLAHILSQEGDHDKAIEILKNAIGEHPNNQRCYFQYAELLRKYKFEETSAETLMFYYERSFSPNDDKYLAQFWYARFGFRSESNESRYKAKQIFNKLKSARNSSYEKRKIRDIETERNVDIKFFGSINNLITDFGFLTVEGSGESIYFNKSDFLQEDMWELMEIGQRLTFSIAYTFMGVRAIKICAV